jgi:hypothetical protein
MEFGSQMGRVAPEFGSQEVRKPSSKRLWKAKKRPTLTGRPDFPSLCEQPRIPAHSRENAQVARAPFATASRG